MQSKNLILLLTFFSFLLMAITGSLMFFIYQDSAFIEVLGMKKNGWLTIHMIAAATTSIFVFYHVAMRWEWIENVIFRKVKEKPTSAIRKKIIINSLMMIVYSLSLSTGFLNYLLEGECLICEEYHGTIGIVSISVFLLHMIIHSFPSKKYLK